VLAGVEDLIERSAMRWTMLRPGPFALNYRNWWAPQIHCGDIVRWFHGAAQTAAVHERDVAAVAVRTLCEERHEGRDYVLTGAESLTQRAQPRRSATPSDARWCSRRSRRTRHDMTCSRRGQARSRTCC
jgi:uncharacterized protein YbjT (DUF2867 family)